MTPRITKTTIMKIQSDMWFDATPESRRHCRRPFQKLKPLLVKLFRGIMGWKMYKMFSHSGVNQGTPVVQPHVDLLWNRELANGFHVGS